MTPPSSNISVRLVKMRAAGDRIDSSLGRLAKRLRRLAAKR